ncbi:hypothetical protein CQS02_20095 [Elizabethkingia miricola]|nr:hypothetical protein CQS02_20095 [Elizabethkingia miricola]
MNSQNKQQAIKAAYGDMWIYMSSFPQARNIALENEGWVFITQLPSTIDRTLFDFQHGDSICRPKSLSGIETNNSWTRIESEEDLQKEYDVDYFCFHKNGRLTIRSFYEYLGWGEFEAEILDQSDITHYQPIETPKPPIF